MKQPRTQYVKSGDGHLAYQVCGAGPIDVVYVVAWASHVEENWNPPTGALLRALASGARLIVFDHRGTGISDPVAIGEMTSLERWMDETLVVLDAVGSDQDGNVRWGGRSGGTLGASCSPPRTPPERISALVLACTSARFTSSTTTMRKFPVRQKKKTPRRSKGYVALVRDHVGNPRPRGLRLPRASTCEWTTRPSFEAQTRILRSCATPGKSASQQYRHIWDRDARAALPLR